MTPTSTGQFWFCTHRFPILFFICYGLYSLIFPYLFMVSKSMAAQYQMGANIFWWFLTVERVTYGLTVIGAAYFGGKSKCKSKWIGYGFTLIAAGCFVLSLTAFIVPLPVIEVDEAYLWKGIYIPASKYDIAHPHNLMKSHWGKRFPQDVQMHLNATGYKYMETDETMEMHNISKRSVEDNEIEQMFADSVINLRRELSFGMEEEEGEADDNSQTHRLVKRQMPDFDFPDSTRDRLKEGFEAAVIGMMWFGDTFEDFSHRVFNLTNDPEIFERLMKAARLPFGYCRNTSMQVRERLRTKTCQEPICKLTFVAFFIALVSVTMMGIGGTVVGTVGLPYIEDLVGWKNLPKYLMALAAIHYISASVGLGLGKIFDKLLYSNLRAQFMITPIDPRWVGAWWLGLLIVFLLMKVFSLFMILGKPKEMKMNGDMSPESETETTTDNGNDVHVNGNTTQDANGATNLEAGNTDQTDRTSYTVNPKPGKAKKQFKVKGFLDAIFVIFRPAVFVSLIFALTFHAMAFSGYFMFLPVYLNNNFLLDAFFNGTYMTATAGLYICLGLGIGTFFVYRLKFNGRKLAMLLVICTFMIFTLSLLQKWIGCHGTIARLQEMSLKNPTNRPSWPSCPGCICDSADFYPVCANDTHRTPFYSPCHAGCANFTYKVAKMDVEFTFDYCACTETKRTLVGKKFCKGDCNMVHGFFYIIFAFISTTAGVLVVPSILMTLRTATDENRSMALAILAFCVFVLGVLPSSVLYRFVTDSSCFVWKSTCGIDRGHCEMYDTNTLRDRFHGFAALLNLLSFLFFVLVWYHSTDLNLGKESDEPAVVEVLVEKKEELEEVNLKDEKPQNGEPVQNGDTAQNGNDTPNGNDQNTFIGKM